MSELLRQYEVWECGLDGYPFAWHHGIPVPFGQARTIEEAAGAHVPAIKDLIREQAGHRCQRCGHPYRVGEHGNGEWSPCDERCAHGGSLDLRWRYPDEKEWKYGRDWIAPRRKFRDQHAIFEAQWRILTCHHLTGVKSDCRPFNLVALCQKCHLSIQRRVTMEQIYAFEHSEWFKPYAAAYYALVYEDRTITIEEARGEMDRLLAYERAV
jgi:hypothetical protein